MTRVLNSLEPEIMYLSERFSSMMAYWLMQIGLAWVVRLNEVLVDLLSSNRKRSILMGY